MSVALAADPNGAAVTNAPAPTITLPPVVVSATRVASPLDESTADVTVVTARDIEESPASTLADALRDVPGFNTFRRSSSVVTAPAEDPEAQGVTLRGIGPGGASRALVLLDGIPVNDAFGGWIYWDELPLDNLERVEVVNGGGSNLWGNEAEGGVINIISQRPEASGVRLRASYGNHDTTDDALTINHVSGALRVSLQGNIFDTGGWKIIAPAFRGPIDGNASSFHDRFGGEIEYDQSDALSFVLRGSYYHEQLSLGTPFRDAGITRGFVSGGTTLRIADFGQFALNAYAHLSSYSQSFSTVNAARTRETPSQLQTVLSTDVGGSFTWTRQLSAANRLLAGSDFRLIDGQSYDSFFNSAGTAISDRTSSSGRQGLFGLFLEEIYRPAENFEVDASVRGDFLQNLDGLIRNAATGTAPTLTRFPNRMRSATSPKLSVRYAPWRQLALRAALYEAFRAPTLAELYRESSVEDLVLLPNPKLSPEFLQGGEAGLDFAPFPGAAFSLTGYWDILHKPIANVVTAVDPVTGADAARTRENLGRARIRGYEIKTTYTPTWIPWGGWSERHPDLTVAVDYLRSEATLVYNPPDPTLEDRRLTLVPWNTGAGSVRYGDDLFGEIVVGLGYQGMQYEDSDNHDRQPAYWLANLTWSRTLPLAPASLSNTRLYLKIQNLLDHAYVIDLGGGIPKLGTPFTLQAGITMPLSSSPFSI